MSQLAVTNFGHQRLMECAFTFVKFLQLYNDDFLPTFDRINGKDKQLIECPVNDPDAILQIMFTGRHISGYSTIMGRSILCYLSYHQSW